MAPNPPRICARCHRVVVGVCSACASRAEKKRGTAHQRGYTGAWAQTSKDWLRQFPWCGLRVDGLFHVEHSQCARIGLRVPATQTDHIRSMKRGGAQFDRANFQSLCASCNARKAVLVEGGFARG